jgi:hypothetical protein
MNRVGCRWKRSWPNLRQYSNSSFKESKVSHNGVGKEANFLRCYALSTGNEFNCYSGLCLEANRNATTDLSDDSPSSDRGVKPGHTKSRPDICVFLSTVHAEKITGTESTDSSVGRMWLQSIKQRKLQMNFPVRFGVSNDPCRINLHLLRCSVLV